MPRIESAIGLLVLLCVTTVAADQSEQEQIEWARKVELARQLKGRQVVVTRQGATLQVPDGPTIDAQIGHLYQVDQIRDNWLWVLRTGAWMDSENVVANSEAETYFTEALKNQPTADTYIHRGVMRSVNGQYSLARNDYESALRLAPDMGAALNGLGNCQWATGQVYEALESYRQAIFHAPNLAAAYNNRGNAWRTLGDFDAAIKDYNQALTIAGEAAMLFNNRGSTFLAMGNLSQAIEDYGQAVLLDAHYPDAFNNRGFALQLQGNFDEAIANYRRAAQYDPKFFRAYNNAAWLRATCPEAGLRDGELALQSAQEACELTDYKLWFCLTTLAAAQAESGDFDSAVQSQLKAISLMPGNMTSEDVAEQTDRLELYRNQERFRAMDYASLARALRRAIR